MTTIRERVQELDAGTRIEVFELDTVPIGGVDKFYFHDGASSVSGAIVWQGKTYQPWPIEGSGWEMNAKGTLPRPKMKIANIGGSISSVVIEWDDLVGAKLIRRRTFAEYLDGQPGADPNQFLPNDVYYVERKVMENELYVEFELASAMDLQGVQLPNRQIMPNTCTWQYRSAECSYTKPIYFNVNDVSVATLALDVCSKKVTGCKVRFGAKSPLPFGGFPAARTYKV